MREILFRGQRSNGEWVYGMPLIFTKNYAAMVYPFVHQISVEPKTIGQFTGLYDNTKWEELTVDEQAEFLYPKDGGKHSKEEWKGKPIFEGDIVKSNTNSKHYEIKMRKGAWVIFNEKGKTTYETWDFLNTFASKVKIIGNIHDNHELLGGAE